MLIVLLDKGKKMLKFIKILVFILISLNAIAVYAHPGHGHHSGHSILHYFTSPMHVLPLILVVGAVVFTLVQRQMKKMDKEKIKD